jgi:predicted dehydrogenase
VFPGYARRVEISGSEGTLVLEHDRLERVDLRSTRSRPPAGTRDTNLSATSAVVSDASAHRRILEDFIRAIETGAQPACDGREGRKSLAIVEAIYRSARTGRAVVMGG